MIQIQIKKGKKIINQMRILMMKNQMEHLMLTILCLRIKKDSKIY